MDRSITLASNPWLSELPDQPRKQLIHTAHVRRYKAGQRIHNKGGQADGLYGVVSGEVNITATTHNGNEIVFTRLLPGEWFGEIALLDGGIRTHDAHALVASELAVLPKTTLIRLSQQWPEVHNALVQLLCRHCRHAFDAIDDFILLSPEQLLAKRIIERVNKAHPATTYISINQHELGQLVGLSRQSVNKILKAWEVKGWAKRNYGKLEINSSEALSRLFR